jgi:hypothetical protein
LDYGQKYGGLSSANFVKKIQQHFFSQLDNSLLGGVKSMKTAVQ